MEEATGPPSVVKVKMEPSERSSTASPTISRGKAMKQKREKKVKKETKLPRTVTRKKLKVKKVVKNEMKSMKATVRPPHKERAWQAVLSAPFVAEQLRREAPDPVDFRTGSKEMVKVLRSTIKMTIGSDSRVPGKVRARVPQLRAAFEKVRKTSNKMSNKTGNFVRRVVDSLEELFDKTCRNTDSAWKPFISMLLDLCVLGEKA